MSRYARYIILALAVVLLSIYPSTIDTSTPAYATDPYITKVVDFERWSSGGWYNSASYTDVQSSSQWLYTAANFDGTVEVYFEAVLTASAGNTAYAQLTWQDGTAVGGSEVSTTQTTATRVRSGNIFSNMTNAKVYKARVKTSASTMYCRGARLVIVQSGTITATETEIQMTDTVTPGGADYADSTKGSIFYYDADQYDGTVNVYFEGMSTGWTAVYYRLVDASNTPVTGSNHTKAGDGTLERWRSAALTLVDNTEYHVQVRGGLIYDLKVIITQSGSPTKTESYYGIEQGQLLDQYGQTSALSQIYWDETEWSGSTKSVFYETTVRTDNATYPSASMLFTGATIVSNQTTVATSFTRMRSAGLSLTDHTEYDVKTGQNTPNNNHQKIDGSRLVIQSTFGTTINARPTFIGVIIGM
jgi:hypothetical protein